MAGVIYAHQVDAGIKIGWTTNYKQRCKTYASHGDTIQEIAVCRTATIEHDTIIKKALVNLGRQVKIADQSSTEVYQLSAAQARDIVAYLSLRGVISEQIIANILAPESVWQVEKITLRDIKRQYGGQLVPFKFQRDPTIKHTEEIREYIMTCYMEPWFRIPEITLCRLDDMRSEILDGNHRCIAVSQIPDDHPALSLSISCCRAVRLTEPEKIRVFRDLNKSKPMPDIYVKENYIEYYTGKVNAQLIARYGPEINTPRPFSDRVAQFITSENIISLINTGDIQGIGYRELYNYIVQLNDLVLSVYNYVAQHDDVYKAMCEINRGPIILKDFKEAAAELERSAGKKIKHKFILNLVPRVKLVELKAHVHSMYEI
jgi:hypothetical protein